MDAVVLGAVAGALFGAMAVAVRWALARGGDIVFGPCVMTTTAAVVATVIALPSALDGIEPRDLLPFALLGLAVPGMSQIVFVLAIRHAGAARAAILIGTAPLFSVVAAIVLLDEPLHPVLLVATVLVVAGGGVLVAERGRPGGLRALGVLLGLACAVLFAARDIAVRFIAVEVDPPGLQASAASLLAAAIATSVAAVVMTRRRPAAGVLGRAVRSFVPAGLLLGVAYGALVVGLDRGRVGIIAPLNATQSLWGVVLAAALFSHTEAIGRRTVLAGLLVVTGAVFVGAVR